MHWAISKNIMNNPIQCPKQCIEIAVEECIKDCKRDVLNAGLYDGYMIGMDGDCVLLEVRVIIFMDNPESQRLFKLKNLSSKYRKV